MNFDENEIKEFKIEAFELLSVAEKSLLNLETGADFKPEFDAIFRVFHNLKGASGMMGLTALGQVMHHLENRLNETKAHQKMTHEEIEIFLKGVDEARHLLNSNPQDLAVEPVIEEPELKPAKKEESQDGFQEFVFEAQEISNRLSRDLECVEIAGLSPELVDSIYRDVHTLKGGAFLFNLKELGALNHAMESILEVLREDSSRLGPKTCEELIKAVDLVDMCLEGFSENPQTELMTAVEKAILRLNFCLGPETNKQKPISPEPMEIPAPRPVIETQPKDRENKFMSETHLKSNQDSTSTPESNKEADGSVRVSVNLLDKLMTLMGEMVLVRNQVIQYTNKNDDLEFHNLSQRLNVVTGEIQTEMMKTRMQPISNVVSKFSRLVRELSKDLGKKIDLHLSGAETELDKTLLEAVKDPLTHIIRNSCDHGIETPSERVAAGKADGGNIFLNSFHEGGQVVIEIKDDGKGLHREKLLKKAIEKGILPPERASQLSDREIVNLIFAPGFSTAAQVTNVSGRGVGMDVVRTNIEKIGGTVEIQSVEGAGTTIRLKIPLTLAIIPAMIVRCQHDYFAIPQLKLVELVRVEQSSEQKIEFVQAQPVFRLRGNILPLLHIHQVLGLSDKFPEQQEATNIVVLKNDQFCFGLIVDEIQDTADIVVKPLARFLKPLGIYSGATVLGDGAIALILDVAGIVKYNIEETTQESQNQKLSSEENKRRLEDLQDFLLLKANSPTKHAILLGYVHRLEEFKLSEIELSGNRRIIRYRNSVLPLICLDEALNLSKTEAQKKESESADVFPVVVIEMAGANYGLVVNEILDVLTTESELDTSIRTNQGIIGNLVTPEEIIVVVDPYEVIRRVMGLERSVLKSANLPTEGAQLSEKHSKFKNILYVEDAAFFRRQVSKSLQSQGFKVTTANNGREALDLLEKTPVANFDLILSDIEMPLMNGYELAKEVRKNKQWSQVPMVALSTRANSEHRQEGIRSGFDAYLEKLNSEELFAQIEDLSRKKAA